MNSQMVLRLAWKDYRTHRSLWISVAFVTIALELLFVGSGLWQGDLATAVIFESQAIGVLLRDRAATTRVDVDFVSAVSSVNRHQHARVSGRAGIGVYHQAA